MPRDVLINGPSDPLDGLWTAGKLRRVAVAPHTYNAGMLLENMTWPEVERIDFSKTPVVIPLGSVEQHGPRLPLTTDTEIVTAIAREVESRMHQRILVARPCGWAILRTI